jgi:hypothetical protein
MQPMGGMPNSVNGVPSRHESHYDRLLLVLVAALLLGLRLGRLGRRR